MKIQILNLRIQRVKNSEVLEIKEHCGQLPHELLDFKCGNFVLARVFFTT